MAVFYKNKIIPALLLQLTQSPKENDNDSKTLDNDIQVNRCDLQDIEMEDLPQCIDQLQDDLSMDLNCNNTDY